MRQVFERKKSASQPVLSKSTWTLESKTCVFPENCTIHHLNLEHFTALSLKMPSRLFLSFTVFSGDESTRSRTQEHRSWLCSEQSTVVAIVCIVVLTPVQQAADKYLSFPSQPLTVGIKIDADGFLKSLCQKEKKASHPYLNTHKSVLNVQHLIHWFTKGIY